MILHSLLAVTLLVSAAQDPKEEKKAAREKVKAFKATIKKAKEASDIILALESLGDTQHDVIRAELVKWLKYPDKEVKKEAARQMAAYKKNAKAAADLLQHAGKERDEEAAVKFLEVVGEIGAREVAKALIKFFRDNSIDKSYAAIEASGLIKSRLFIQPLISLLKELEAIKDDPDEPGGPELPGDSDDDKRLKRKNQLMPIVIIALKDITGEKWSKAGEWEAWWAKNRKTWKEPD